MALLLLAQDNIEYTKLYMREAFPHVRSAHRTEALAASLGSRTYASLLATPVAKHHAARFFDSARFSARLQELGYTAVDGTPLVAIIRSPLMPLRPWAEFKDGDLAANNRWFYACQRRNIPDLYIELRAKYAKLNWDCISRDREDDTHRGEDDGADLVSKMFAKFNALKGHSSGKAMFQGTSFVGEIDNLLPDVARDIADEFYTMLIAPPRRAVAA